MNTEDTWDKVDYDYCICGGDWGCRVCGLDGSKEEEE